MYIQNIVAAIAYRKALVVSHLAEVFLIIHKRLTFYTGYGVYPKLTSIVTKASVIKSKISPSDQPDYKLICQ